MVQILLCSFFWFRCPFKFFSFHSKHHTATAITTSNKLLQCSAVAAIAGGGSSSCSSMQQLHDREYACLPVCSKCTKAQPPTYLSNNHQLQHNTKKRGQPDLRAPEDPLCSVSDDPCMFTESGSDGSCTFTESGNLGLGLSLVI